MIYIENGAWYQMSAIIGICSTNFCSFIADKRKTTNLNGTYVFDNDETQKIFKVHENLLFGATGLFNADEEIYDAIKPLLANPNISLECAVQSTLAFLEAHKYRIPKMRNYLLGGKNKEGKYSMYFIHMDFETYAPKITLFQPQPPTSNYAISLLVPPEISQYQAQYINSIELAIRSSSSVTQMLKKAASVIHEISEVNNTVSRDAMVLSLLE